MPLVNRKKIYSPVYENIKDFPPAFDDVLLDIRRQVFNTAISGGTENIDARTSHAVWAASRYQIQVPLSKYHCSSSTPFYEAIKKEIDEAFAKHYEQAPMILNRLNQATQNIVYRQLQMAEPQNLQAQYRLILEYLQRMFGVDLSPEHYFTFAATGKIVGFNWNQVRKGLFEALVRQEYFQLSPQEQFCMLHLLEYSPGQETTYDLKTVASLWVSNTDTLCNLLSFLSHLNVDMQMGLILAYVDTLNAKEQMIALAKIAQTFEDRPDLVAQIKHFCAEEAVKLWDDDIHQRIIRSLMAGKEKDPLYALSLLYLMHTEAQARALTQLDAHDNPVAHYAMSNGKAAFVFDIVSRLPVEHQERILIGYDYPTYYVVEMPMLTLIQRLPIESQVKILGGTKALAFKMLYQHIVDSKALELNLTIFHMVTKWPFESFKTLLMSNDTRYLGWEEISWYEQNIQAVQRYITSHQEMVTNPIDQKILQELSLYIELAKLDSKIEGFKALPDAEYYYSPFNVTHRLCEALKASFDTYKSSVGTPEDRQILKQTWETSINAARPVLSEHRGMKEILCSLLLALTGIGLVYMVFYSIFNPDRNLIQTDSEEKLDDALKAVSGFC